MDNKLIDNVVGPLIDYKGYWCSENMFVYENENVYIFFNKNENLSLSESEQITYLCIVNNLKKIVNQSLQAVKKLFYEEKLFQTRLKCILIETNDYYKVFGYFNEEDFNFSILFDRKCEAIKFDVEKLI